MTYSDFYVCDDHPMYVQRWGSAGSARRVVLVHGGVHTGVCGTSRPNGQPGWAQFLAEQGWAAYVIDWPGVGRSTGTGTLLESTADHVVAALAALVREIGPALLIGHSIGAALCAKVMEFAPEHVTGLVSIAPAPHGNVDHGPPRAPLPNDQAILFDEAAMQAFFCNAPRFPIEAIEQYRRSLCGMSPGVMNALGAGSLRSDLLIEDPASVSAIPKLIVAGDNDQLVVSSMSMAIAASLGAPHITVGKDWDLNGFGHMIPIEHGSEEILMRCLDWFEAAAKARL